MSSPVQGASPAQTWASARPSRAHGHHLRPSTNCYKLSDRRQRLPRRCEVLTWHGCRMGLAVDQARETPWSCSLTHNVEEEKLYFPVNSRKLGDTREVFR